MNAQLHDAICTAGAYGIAVTLIGMALPYILPWIWRKTRFFRMRGRAWVRYRRAIAQIRQDARRYKAAMRVFDEPLKNWREE